jgi:hypothetical protein
MCSLRFENNLLTIEGVRFASISKKTPLSKLSFAFVSLALPLLVVTLLYKYRISGILKFNSFVTIRAPFMHLHSLHACRKSLPDGRRWFVDQRYKKKHRRCDKGEVSRAVNHIIRSFSIHCSILAEMVKAYEIQCESTEH